VVVGGKGGEFACAHSLPSLRLSQLFHCQDVLKVRKAHREPADPLDRRAPPGRRARKARPDHPGRKEKRACLEPPALPACPVRRELGAASVRQGRPVPRVRPGQQEAPVCTPSARRRATPNACFYAPLARSSSP
jgi:hypothetical protein